MSEFVVVTEVTKDKNRSAYELIWI